MITLGEHAGRATLDVERVAGASAVTSAYATSPVKLLVPRARGPSAWVCMTSFGGGLVGGDRTRLTARIGPGARCYLGTQSSTKVYRRQGAKVCHHRTDMRLEADSLLVFAPDPVQAFAGSAYSQSQSVHLAPGASLLMVDGVVSGRMARGERWKFDCLELRNELWQAGGRPAMPGTPPDGDRLIYADSLRLDPSDGPIDGPFRMGRFDILASVLLFGPLLEPIRRRILDAVAQRPVTRRPATVLSASPVAGGLVLKLAGVESEQVTREWMDLVGPMEELLGDSPWRRRF